MVSDAGSWTFPISTSLKDRLYIHSIQTILFSKRLFPVNTLETRYSFSHDLFFWCFLFPNRRNFNSRGWEICLQQVIIESWHWHKRYDIWKPFRWEKLFLLSFLTPVLITIKSTSTDRPLLMKIMVKSTLLDIVCPNRQAENKSGSRKWQALVLRLFSIQWICSSGKKWVCLVQNERWRSRSSPPRVFHA